MSIVKAYKRASGKVTSTPRWKRLRHAILERDGYQCVQCTRRTRLEIDHIQPVRSHPELSFEPRNLQTLCVSCHSKKTRKELGFPELSPERRAWRDLLKGVTP